MFFKLFVKFVQKVGIETVGEGESYNYDVCYWEYSLLGLRFYVEDNPYGIWARLSFRSHTLYEYF